jgi:acyl carrier protein
MPDEASSTVEQTLAAIWNEVLQRFGDVSDSDRFFQLGGDSVAMMMLLFRVEKALRVELNPEQVYEDDSFRVMVDRIISLQTAPVSASEVI